jgi:CDP-diacylglycerol--glycerol-3-phosphate 3-phosphatidyltransferase
MAAYALKPRFRAALKPIETPVTSWGVSADTVTAAGLVASGLAAASIVAAAWQPPFLAAVAPLVILRLACNAIDGMIAQDKGTSSAWGFVLNECADRAADVLILAAVIAYTHATTLGVAAVGLVLLASYMGIVGCAVGGSRQYAGIMGKADRMLLLAVFAFAQMLWTSCPILHVFLATITVGAAITVPQRLLATHRQLAPGSGEGKA